MGLIAPLRPANLMLGNHHGQ